MREGIKERFKDLKVEKIKEEMKKHLPDIDDLTLSRCAGWIKIEANL